MAAVAGRPGGAGIVCWSVERDPPVRPNFNVIWEPLLLRHIPLRREREVVIAAFSEIALLEPAAIRERDLIEREGADRIGVREVADNRFWALLGIQQNIRHPALPPAVVLGKMTAFARFRTNVVRLWGGGTQGVCRSSSLCCTE